MRFISFTIAFVLFTITAAAQEIRSQWQTNPVVINGYADEWPETFRYYDGNTMLQFAIANDTGNVYICLKANDANTQRNLIHAGLNIWLDPKGKKKELTGVVFPMRKEMAMPMQGQISQRRGMNEMKQQVLLSQNTLVVYGLAGTGKEIVPIKGNTYGVETAISWDSLDIMVIEYKIPVAALLTHSFSAADTGKLLSFGLVIAAEKMTPGERRQPDDMDQDPNSGGMANGGLMRNSAVGGDINRSNDPMNANPNTMQQSGGSMGFNGPPPNMYIEQDQRAWFKLRLAAK